MVITKLFTLYSSGPAASFNIVDGFGFANREAVTTHWGSPTGQVLGTSTTDYLGTFAGPLRITFTIPMSPTGIYNIYVVGQHPGDIASIPFTISSAFSRVDNTLWTQQEADTLEATRHW